MKLTTPIKSMHDIVDADDISRILVVSLTVDSSINIAQLQTKGPFVGSFHKGQFTGSMPVTEVVHFSNKLKQIRCVQFSEYPMLCKFSGDDYLCEDLFMAARFIHEAMRDLQWVCEAFDVDPCTDESVKTIAGDCFDHVVKQANEPGGLISLYKKDLRKNTPVKLPDNYFGVFPVGIQ